MTSDRFLDVVGNLMGSKGQEVYPERKNPMDILTSNINVCSYCSRGKEQFYQRCLEAVKYDGHAIRYLRNPSPEICLEAVKENGTSIAFIENQTEELCLEAVKQNWRALRYIWEQTEEMCLVAVKQNGMALEYVQKQTPEVCLEAVKQDYEAYVFVKPKFRGYVRYRLMLEQEQYKTTKQGVDI